MTVITETDVLNIRKFQAELELFNAEVAGVRQRAGELVSVARALDDRIAELEQRLIRMAGLTDGLQR